MNILCPACSQMWKCVYHCNYSTPRIKDSWPEIEGSEAYQNRSSWGLCASVIYRPVITLRDMVPSYIVLILFLIYKVFSCELYSDSTTKQCCIPGMSHHFLYFVCQWWIVQRSPCQASCLPRMMKVVHMTWQLLVNGENNTLNGTLEKAGTQTGLILEDPHTQFRQHG